MARVENSSSKSSHWGIDACGDEIFHGDTIFQFPNGEIVLYENLPEYLIRLGVKEKTAK